MSRIKKILLYGFLIAVLLTCLYPIIWMIMMSFKTTNEVFTNPFGLPKGIYIQNYVDAISRYNISRYFLNSLVVTSVTTFLVCAFSSMFAFAIARMKWKLQGLAYIYVIIGMFIPVQIVLLPLSQIFSQLNLNNTLLSLIIPYTAFGLPMGCVVFYAYFRGLQPEIEESAALDGANICTAFFKIVLPLIKPAFAMVSIYTVITAWNEFTMALVLITKEELKTLPLGLIAFQGKFATNYGAMGASLTIASVPTIVLYLLFSRQFENAISTSAAVKG